MLKIKFYGVIKQKIKDKERKKKKQRKKETRMDYKIRIK